VAIHVLKDERRPRQFKTSASSADAFSAQHSCSYPEWLEKLTKKG